jgi:hypothetical protein
LIIIVIPSPSLLLSILLYMRVAQTERERDRKRERERERESDIKRRDRQCTGNEIVNHESWKLRSRESLRFSFPCEVGESDKV